MADGDVLGILLLAQKQYQLAFLSGLHMFALSLFPIFSMFSQHFGTRLHHPFRTGATNYYLQTRPASVISSQGPRYLSLPPPPILCRVQMFVGSLE